MFSVFKVKLRYRNDKSPDILIMLAMSFANIENDPYRLRHDIYLHIDYNQKYVPAYSGSLSNSWFNNSIFCSSCLT